MNLWPGTQMISIFSLAFLLMAACSSLAEEQVHSVIGGGIFTEGDRFTAVGFGFEGEDVVSPGPSITVRVREPVTITFENVDDYSGVPHDFVIVADKNRSPVPLWGAQTEHLPFGDQQSITFTPDTPGTYFYICSVGSHRFAGMWGSFVVEG